MKTIKIKAYEFNELSDAAKEKAREWWREHNCDDSYWSEYTIEEAVREGELLGITFKTRKVPLMSGKTRDEPCIYWSGFSSQGDGACFEGTWSAKDVQADKVADGWGDDPTTTELKRIATVFAEIAKEWPNASFTVTHSGHYQHKYCTDFDVSVWDEDERSPDDELWNKVHDSLVENARDFMDWIYRQLEKEYEYRQSDECVDEEITANEYYFTEDGKRSTVL